MSCSQAELKARKKERANMAIRQVWRHNLEEELVALHASLYSYPVISVDTEFPGSIMKSERDADESKQYSALKFNVENTNMIQLGVTLSAVQGRVFRTWEFNFAFDLEKERHDDDSIEFLKKNDIDFERLKTHGIDMSDFRKTFARILGHHMNVVWVTFQGLYDLAYVMHLLVKGPLPDTVSLFAELAERLFGTVIDVKFMASLCRGLQGGKLGLQKLANILGIERLGGAHHAGSDSLLTARVFAMIRMMFRPEPRVYEGFLYGISAKICRRQNKSALPQAGTVPVHCLLNPVEHHTMYNPFGVVYVPIGFNV